MPASIQTKKFNFKKTSFEIFFSLRQLILDLLFPIRCLGCGEEQNWICEKCLAKIARVENQVCPRCEKVSTKAGQLCETCRNFYYQKNIFPPLDNLILAVRYPKKEHGVAHFIHFYKYRFVFGLAEPLGKLLVEAFLKNSLTLPDFIIPVPLHPRRLRWRGFNQAEKLATYLSQNLTPGLPLALKADSLKRTKYTPPQMSLEHYNDRKNNLLGAFVVNPSDLPEIKNRTILLVDDVVTTGATLEECAKSLKEAGAKKVMAMALSRQEMA